MAHPAPHPVAAGQESVWDYPRPPRIEAVDRRVTIELGGRRILDTTDVVRVLETSHPPVYYLPIAAFADGSLVPARGASFCEFKGSARYFDVVGGEVTALIEVDAPVTKETLQSLRELAQVISAQPIELS